MSWIRFDNSGTKNDLNTRILRYLNNEKQIAVTKYQSKNTILQLTPSTRIIDGVKLNQNLREFMVKDFCADSMNNNIKNKLDTAAKLWSIAKNKKSKKYTRDLFKYFPYLK